MGATAAAAWRAEEARRCRRTWPAACLVAAEEAAAG